MGRKITLEEVKEYIESFGYEFYGFEIGKTKGVTAKWKSMN